MFQIRPAAARGHANHGWLDSHHSFSFAGYHDPEQMGFRSLRVINEDRVQPGQGFGTHAHRDMEIVSYVLDGELEHQDSMGHGEVLRPGEFQRITAGTGITHSEFNPSSDQVTHFYQIWLLPERKGLPPGYQQQSFSPAGRDNQLQLVASPDGADGSLLIHQDARIQLVDLHDGGEVSHTIQPGRHVWLQVLRGQLLADGQALHAGDGVAVSEADSLRLQSDTRAEAMLFDLN